jgi:hypothetical protein
VRKTGTPERRSGFCARSESASTDSDRAKSLARERAKDLKVRPLRSRGGIYNEPEGGAGGVRDDQNPLPRTPVSRD